MIESRLYMEWGNAVGVNDGFDNTRIYIDSFGLEPTEHVSEEWRKIAERLPSATVEFSGMFEPVDFPSIDIDIAADGTPSVLRYAGRTFKLVEEM